MRFIQNIAYADGEGRLLDVYLPEGAAKATVLFLHGGGLEGGSKSDMEPVAREVIQAGLAFVSADYRMYPRAKFPAFLEDGAKAVRWVFDHLAEYNLREPLYLGGSSAGSYIASMLCFDRRYLAAEGLSPERLAGYILNDGQPTTHFNVLRERGFDPRLCLIDDAAALYYARDARPARPLCVVYTEDDIPCRPEQNRLFVATLKSLGYDPALIEEKEMKGFPHCGHDSARDEQGRNLLAQLMLDFIARHGAPR